MKSVLLAAIIIILCSTSFPLLTLKNPDVSETSANLLEKFDLSEVKAPAKAVKAFRIKSSETGEITSVLADEYIIGVLCGEMSPGYSPEALKAQAVAAYTFAVKRAADAEKQGRDYDLTDSPDTDQCYISKDKIFEKWGESAQKNYETIENAVKSVSGQLVLYDNSPALTVYHAISSGVTNSAEDVWGGNIPYLTSVDSTGDKLSKNYLSALTLTEAELSEKLGNILAVTTGANAFSDMNVSKTGRVISVKSGDAEIKCEKIIKALGLASGNFTVEYKDGCYSFTVKGRGHGVGMSQSGAEYMARQGSGYEEILLHYYTGCKLKK